MALLLRPTRPDDNNAARPARLGDSPPRAARDHGRAEAGKPQESGFNAPSAPSPRPAQSPSPMLLALVLTVVGLLAGLAPAQPADAPAAPAEAPGEPAGPAGEADAGAGEGEPAAPGEASGPPGQAEPEPIELTEDQRRELDLLLDVVDDGRLELAKRRDAAAALLARGWPEAVAALAERLRTAETVELRRAIAASVALRDEPPEAMVEPLMAWVGSEDAMLRADVSAALGRYENAGVSGKLIALARDAEASRARRTGAIHALAEHRQAEVIDGLIGLVDDGEPAAVREAAFAALGRLTGIREHGRSADAWRRWWRQHRDLPRDRWLARLVRSLSERNRRLANERDALTKRLAETYGQVYRAMPDGERPALLVRMLGDGVVEVRLQALDLIERKLLNAQSIAAPVRTRLRGLMDDPSTEVRAHAIALLRDLDDEPAVELAIDKVAGEPDGAVQRAYLTMMAHRPLAQAFEPAMALLNRRSVRAEAAAVLGGLAEEGLLDESQRAAARDRALALLDNGEVAPAVVELVSRLAVEDDADRLEALLDHDSPAVRLAAAEAFTSGRLDPGRLLEEMGDEVLGGRAIEAAARHGRTLEVATRLLQHEPADGEAEARQNWRTAVVAVAGRLDAEALARLDRSIGEAEARRDLRLAVLNHAMSLNGEAATRGDRATLLLRLADLRLDAGRVDEAGAVVDRLSKLDLEGEQAKLAAGARLRWLSASGQYERLLGQAEALLAAGEASASMVGRRLMDAASAAMEEQKTEQAAALLARVQQLDTDQALAEASRKRLVELRRQLTELQSNPPPAEG